MQLEYPQEGYVRRALLPRRVVTMVDGEREMESREIIVSAFSAIIDTITPRSSRKPTQLPERGDNRTKLCKDQKKTL